MSGSRTRLQAAAEAGFSEGPPCCDEIEKGKIVSAPVHAIATARVMCLSGFTGGVP